MGNLFQLNELGDDSILHNKFLATINNLVFRKLTC